MADKAITELVEASQVTAGDLFVLQQDNTAKKLSGQTLINYLLRMIDGHGGVRSYEKISTSGLKDTYRFTFADESTLDIVVTNGRAITSVAQTAVNGLTRTYTIDFNDSTSETFEVVDGRAIYSIQQTASNGLARTYTIEFNDGTSETFQVKDGRSITGFSKTSTSGLVDTYTLTYNDGTTGTLTVTNGEKGDKGDNVYLWIKYASQEPTEASHSIGNLPDDWIGIYSGNLDSAPEDWSMYVWFKIKGEKGDTGDPATVVTNKVDYQVSSSGSIIPSGSWQTNVPVVPQGQYLWTRTVTQFNTGDPVTAYSVARFGIDGSGSVSSVANISPDEDGNVPLTASNIGALPDTGGDMTGPINMNGQSLSGLNPPTESDQAANKGYVDTAKQEATDYTAEQIIAANTYTNEQVKKAAPRNLLDNSDFTNPVNQRGETSYVGQVGGKYGIDRWNVENEYSTMTIDGNGITFSANGLDIYPFQKVPVSTSMRGKYYTAAICLADGTICVFANGVLPQDIPSMDTQIGASYYVPGIAAFSLFAHRDGTMMLQIRVIDGQSISLRWAALYEGEYTEETLPEYREKGYAVELAECMRYYQIRSANNISAVDMRPPMRLSSPTITSVTNGYSYSADL